MFLYIGPLESAFVAPGTLHVPNIGTLQILDFLIIDAHLVFSFREKFLRLQ
jgi:hypothetical protein